MKTSKKAQQELIEKKEKCKEEVIKLIAKEMKDEKGEVSSICVLSLIEEIRLDILSNRLVIRK